MDADLEAASLSAPGQGRRCLTWTVRTPGKVDPLVKTIISDI